MTLTDEEVRHFAITLLTLPTARDKQKSIGASNLSNPCWYCLAANFMGDQRESSQLSRPWGGRVNGTAVHLLMQERLDEYKRRHLERLQVLYPDAIAELKMLLGHINGYGDVGTTSDLVIPSRRHGGDYKGIDEHRGAILQDYLGKTEYGRKHKLIKLSEREYAIAMLKAAYKFQGYFSQCQLYMGGLWNMGIPMDRFSLIFITRDATMWFDNPAFPDYENPARAHGVWVQSFDWNPAHANAMWDRGVQIWQHLSQGGQPIDFPSHPLCYSCGLEKRVPPVTPDTLVTAA